MRITSLVSAALLTLTVVGCSDEGDGTGTQVGLDLVLVIPTTVSLQAGTRQTIAVAGVDKSNVTLTDVTFTYASASPNIAVVSSTGVVVAFAAGTSVITVTGTRAGVTKTATVTVTVTGTLANAATIAAGAASNDFTPNFLVIARGGTVSWTFAARTHNVTFGAATTNAPANIPSTGNATTPVARTFSSPGTYDYTCTLHANMGGTIMVP